MVFQYPENQLFKETVYEDIAFGPKSMKLNNIEKRVRKAMDFVGLDESFENRNPLELSGGEKRKVAIAGIIAIEPEILILDEPTVGLDQKSKKEILRKIRKYKEEKKSTVIIVSHDERVIAENADRALYLESENVGVGVLGDPQIENKKNNTQIKPELKIMLTVIYTIALFFINNFIAYGVILCGLIAIIFVSKISVFEILKLLKKILPIVIFTALINLFFVEGETIWQLSFIKISKEGIEFAGLMVTRVIFLILGNSILTYTTTPMSLAKGVENIARPLKKIKFPVKEFAVIMMLSLRFIPILEEETTKITMAQKSRGINLDTKNFIKKAKLLSAIIIPLIISILRRSEQIAIAMDSRCYNYK